MDLQPQDHYKKLCDDHRFFGDLRFKQLTVWAVGMGALINARLSANLNQSFLPLIWFSGIGLTTVFWVFEVRSTLKGVIALRAIREFERCNSQDDKLGKANWTFVNQTNLMALLYTTSYFLWWYRAFAWRIQMQWIQHVFVYIALCCWIMLIVFTFRQYLPLWKKARTDWHW
jgi:hypothetical protein